MVDVHLVAAHFTDPPPEGGPLVERRSSPGVVAAPRREEDAGEHPGDRLPAHLVVTVAPAPGWVGWLSGAMFFICDRFQDDSESGPAADQPLVGGITGLGSFPELDECLA